MATFLDLTPSQRVQAILVRVREPVSKNLALGLAGVDVSLLDEADILEIDSILESAKVHQEGTEDKPTLYSDVESKDEVLARLGLTDREVGMQILAVLRDVEIPPLDTFKEVKTTENHTQGSGGENQG